MRIPRFTGSDQTLISWKTLALKWLTSVVEVRNLDDDAYADLGAKEIILHGANASYKITLSVPTLTADVAFPLPANAGTTDQVLTKTASGSEWATPAPSGIQMAVVTFDEGDDGTPVVVIPDTHANGAIVLDVRVKMTTAASDPAATIAIGDETTASKFLATTDMKMLKTEMHLFQFEATEGVIADGEAVQITVDAQSDTFAGSVTVLWAW